MLGAVGGLVAPMIFEGTALATWIYTIIPSLQNIVSSGQIGLLGGGALLSAGFQAPFMAASLMIELTRKIDMIIPMLITCFVSNYVSNKLHYRY